MGIELGRCWIVDHSVDRAHSKIMATVHVKFRLDEEADAFEGQVLQKVEIPFREEESQKFIKRRIRRNAHSKVAAYFACNDCDDTNIFDDVFETDDAQVSPRQSLISTRATYTGVLNASNVNETDRELELLFAEIKDQVAS